MRYTPPSEAMHMMLGHGCEHGYTAAGVRAAMREARNMHKHTGKHWWVARHFGCNRYGAGSRRLAVNKLPRHAPQTTSNLQLSVVHDRTCA